MCHQIRYNLFACLVLVSLLLSACSAIGVQKTLLPDNSSVVAAAESELTNGNIELASLLALEALENYVYTHQAEYALAQVVQKISPNVVELTGGTLNDAQWSPDGKWIATGDGQNHNKVGIWTWPSAEVVRTLDEMPAGGYYLAWSPDGKKLAVATQGKAFQVWDTTTWELLWEIPREADSPWLYVPGWSLDSKQLAVASDSGSYALILDADSGQVLSQVKSDLEGFMHLRNQSWASKGDRFVAGTLWGPDPITPARVWDATSGDLLLELPGTKGSMVMGAYSPDGGYIATISDAGIVQLWDAVSGEAVSPEVDLSGMTIDVHWSPNGKRLATGIETGTVIVLDALTGARVASYELGEGIIPSVDWSPDGKFLLVDVMGTDPYILPAWQTTEDLISYAKECCAKRELTKEERAKYSLP